MSNAAPSFADEAKERRRRHEAKVHNDRMKALADMGKVAFGALVVGGVVRFLIDPNAPSVGSVQLLLTLIAAAVIGLIIWVVLGLQRPE